MTSLAQWRAAGSSFAYRGHAIFYRDERGTGERAPLVCVHGFPTASWDWHRLWPDLLRNFSRVVAPDMIGFGFSAKPSGHDYSIFDQADLFESLLQSLGISRCHLLAHDYGDTVAQELIARHNERRAKSDTALVIESCVLLNGGLFPEVHRARPIQKLMLTPLGPWLARLSGERQFGRSFSAVFGPRTQPSAAELKDFWALNAHEDGAKLFHRILRYIPERRAHRARWVGALQSTDVRLRLVNGPADPVSGAHMAQRYRELIPDADVVLLAGHIGHYPQVEDAAGTLAALLAFHQRTE